MILDFPGAITVPSARALMNAAWLTTAALKAYFMNRRRSFINIPSLSLLYPRRFLHLAWSCKSPPLGRRTVSWDHAPIMGLSVLPRRLLRCLLPAAMLECMAGWAPAAQPIVRDLPPGLQIPAAAQIGPDFDVDRATEGYLNLLSPEQRSLSDRYFEGGYWIQLWELMWTVGACVLLLVSGVSRRMSELSQRLSRYTWISTPVYIVQFLIALFVLGLPLSLYTDFWREHQYGLSEQAFGGWMRDQLVILGVNT